jgi:two-component system phosphate regulon response regulator PhoB
VAERKCSILVIDADEAISSMLAIALRIDSGRTTTRRNAEDALAALGGDRPDLILCEVDLPGMDGVEFVRRLRADEQFASVPVILMGRAKEPKGHQADAFLAKPFDPLDAVDVVERHVRRRVS